MCFEAEYYRPTRTSPWWPFTGPMQSRIWLQPSQQSKSIHISYRHLPVSDKMIRESMLTVQFPSNYQRAVHIKYDGHNQRATYRLTVSGSAHGGKPVTVSCLTVQFPVNMSMPLSIHLGHNCSYKGVSIVCSKQRNSTVFQVSAKIIPTAVYINRMSDTVATYAPTDFAVITRCSNNR